MATLLAANLALSATASGCASTAKLLREERALAATARDVAGGGELTEIDQLEALRSFLGSSISRDPVLQHLPRPLLRDTAVESLRSGHGFCGENARAAVLMLRALGRDANRVYLIGERWNHVIVEHDWPDGNRYLFDAFGDPATQMQPDQLCRFSSDDPTSFPNVHEGNPWVGYYRWRPLVVRGVARSRPPAGYVGLTERPDLMKAIGLSAAAGAALFATKLLRGSGA